MLKNVRSSIPQITRGPETPGIKPLFHSVRDIALVLDKTVQAGYGFLEAGTVMSINCSTAGGKGKLVPYVPISTKVVLGEDSQIGVAAIIKDCISAHVYVPIADSYMFQIGDDLVLDNDSDEGPIEALAITAIDRTTSTLYADITTSAFVATNFTVAKKSYVHVKAGTSGEFNTAAFILDKNIDSGYGEDALGALTSVVVSNCVLYKNSLVNLTTEAIASLGGVIDGRFFIMK